MNNIFKSSK